VVHIPFELVLTLGPVFATVVVLTVLETFGVRVSRSVKQEETYFNRNASWPIPAPNRASGDRQLAARIGLARGARSWSAGDQGLRDHGVRARKAA